MRCSFHEDYCIVCVWQWCWWRLSDCQEITVLSVFCFSPHFYMHKIKFFINSSTTLKERPNLASSYCYNTMFYTCNWFARSNFKSNNIVETTLKTLTTVAYHFSWRQEHAQLYSWQDSRSLFLEPGMVYWQSCYWIGQLRAQGISVSFSFHK